SEWRKAFRPPRPFVPPDSTPVPFPPCALRFTLSLSSTRGRAVQRASQDSNQSLGRFVLQAKAQELFTAEDAESAEQAFPRLPSAVNDVKPSPLPFLPLTSADLTIPSLLFRTLRNPATAAHRRAPSRGRDVLQ